MPVIEALLLYFAGDPAFESLPVGKNIITEPSLDKGIYLAGNTGSGKSLLMQITQAMEVPGNKFEIAQVDEIKVQYKIKQEEAIIKYYREFIDKGRTVPKIYCFDELGYERRFKNYGETFAFMFDIIVRRNRSWVSERVKTHFTSNHQITEIAELYDYRTAIRIQEMCNIIYLGTDEVYTNYRKAD